MRAALYEDPHDPNSWLIWSYHNKESHDRIRAAIANLGLRLPDYPVDPISSQHIQDFLQYNSELHSEMNAALGLQSSDLLSVDFNNTEQRLAWIAIHAREHESAELRLGL